MKTIVGVQSLVIGVLGLALFNDYLHNVYFRIYLDNAIQNLPAAYSTVTSAAVGLLSGLVLAFVATKAVGGFGMSAFLLQLPPALRGYTTSRKAMKVDLRPQSTLGSLFLPENSIDQNALTLTLQNPVIV